VTHPADAIRLADLYAVVDYEPEPEPEEDDDGDVFGDGS